MGTTFSLFKAVIWSAGVFKVWMTSSIFIQRRYSDADWTFSAALNSTICCDLCPHSTSLAEVIPQVIPGVRVLKTTVWANRQQLGGSNSREWARSLPNMDLTASIIKNTHFYSFWEKVLHVFFKFWMSLRKKWSIKTTCFNRTYRLGRTKVYVHKIWDEVSQNLWFCLLLFKRAQSCAPITAVSFVSQTELFLTFPGSSFTQAIAHNSCTKMQTGTWFSSSSFATARRMCLGAILPFLLSRAAFPANSRISAATHQDKNQ